MSHLDIRQDAALNAGIEKLRKKTQNPAVIGNFSKMYTDYLSGFTGKIPWSEIRNPKPDALVRYSMLTAGHYQSGHAALNQVAVLKLNGGLGTTMGCMGPKSLVEVTDGQTFLDVILNQLTTLRTETGIQLPLILLNSFSTHQETQDFLAKKAIPNLYECIQHQFPKIDAKTRLPFEYPKDPQQEWNPPGHGDVYFALSASGLLDELLAAGLTTLFISNSDNLGASIDFKILGYLIQNNLEFIMETTPKTPLDVKGGTLVEHRQHLTLLERAQVEGDRIPEFEDIKRFNVFNTNNIWVNLPALAKRLKKGELALPTIINPKTIDGTPVVQLESAMGAAISAFDKTASVVVPRHRFLPVKKMSDLFLIRSDLFEKNQTGEVVAKTGPEKLPSITLDSSFNDIKIFDKRMRAIPKIATLKRLKIDGGVRFKRDVTLSGSVTIANTSNQPLTLENCQLADVTVTADKYGNMTQKPI